MSLELDRSQPRRLIVKATGGRLFLWTKEKKSGSLQVASIEEQKASGSDIDQLALLAAMASSDTLSIPYSDAVELRRYILCNEDLADGDPRLAFFEELRNIRIGTGYNGAGSRRILIGGF